MAQIIGRLASSTADVYRQQFQGGRRKGHALHLSGIACVTPLPGGANGTSQLYVDSDGTKHVPQETYLDGLPDIQRGDRLVIGERTYEVVSAGKYDIPGVQAMKLAMVQREDTARWEPANYEGA